MGFSCGLQIRITAGPGRGQTLPLDSPEITIGRARNPGDRAHGWILLHDETVSRTHAQFLWDEDSEAFTLQHKSDTNLTYVNDEAVERHLLKPDDEIRMGSTTLQLQKTETRFAPTQKARTDSTSLASRKRFDQIDPYGVADKPTVAQKAVGMGASGDLALKVIEGPLAGTELKLAGNWICLTPPADTVEDDDSERPLFDQHLDLEDASLPTESAILVWDERTEAYRIQLTAPLSARVYREIDGIRWETAIEPDGDGVKLRSGDELQIAGNRLVLSQATPEPKAGVSLSGGLPERAASSPEAPVAGAAAVRRIRLD